MSRSSMIAALASLFVLGTSAVSPALAANGDYRVQARIRTGTPLEAKGVYRERLVNSLTGQVLRQRFTVEINGATPSTQYEVKLNGTTVSLITTDALGHAEIQFSTVVPDNNPGDNKPPLPTDFPHINAGDTLTVGTLTGTFRAN
ncbi:MAG: hypothetical protein K2W85_06745 [Phycisphaerales bacterium]|nr:hypothetical protein [Phycisphaerales bacterium]